LAFISRADPTCPHDNQVATTDDAGHFTLSGIQTAGFTLWARRAGYDATPYDIAVLPRDQHPDISLTPHLTIRHNSIAFVFPGSCGPCSRDFYSFPVHHNSEVTVDFCQSYSFDAYAVSLIEGSPNPPLPEFPYPPVTHTCSTTVGSWTWPVQAGRVYTLRGYGDPLRGFVIDFSHPN
jgi:hypothetical protein